MMKQLTMNQKLLRAAYLGMRASCYTKPLWQKNLAPWQSHVAGDLPFPVTVSILPSLNLRIARRGMHEALFEVPLQKQLMVCGIEELE